MASEAMSLLAEAAGCDPTLSHANILATVVNQLQQASQITPTNNIAEFKHLNKKLKDQVDILEQHLLNKDEKENYKDKVTGYVAGGKRKNSGTKEIKKKAKIRGPTYLLYSVASVTEDN